jgi:peptidoglycan hydrolase-like protein with peptidoglycan-binding domain
MSALKEALVARVSYLRPAYSPERAAIRAHRRLTASPSRQNRRGRFVVGGSLLAIVGVIAAAALLLVSAKASLNSDSNALANVGMPLGGGKIESVTVRTGPHSRLVPVEIRGDQIWPTHLIPAHRLLSIDVVIKRPGWVSWLAGKTQHLHLNMMTPSASLRQHYLTLGPGQPIVLTFKDPIRVLAVGTPGHLNRQVLHTPLTTIKLHRTAEAGTLAVAAQMRSWETSPPTVISWFPTGASTAAVASPAPGTQITSHTAITLTFSKPIAKVLGANRPPVSPAGSGSWQTVNEHTIKFVPTGYGYGLGSPVSIPLPNGVRLVGGATNGTSTTGNWTVPKGSTLRLQQLLAKLGYLPFTFKGKHVPRTPAAQESAAINPPKGAFDWAYRNVPDALRSKWSPGASGVLTQGAIMAFQNDHGFTTIDGQAGPAVWKALITAVDENKRSTFGYSFVHVSLGGQSLTLWHNGKDVITGTAVNTGIASRPTDPGTFPVYSHLRVTTMSGTNPDGSHYDDPGIQFVSYFNGGDALHAFTRAQYGFPQSLGCVEMPLGPAGEVWPYTPIGTIVDVA